MKKSATKKSVRKPPRTRTKQPSRAVEEEEDKTDRVNLLDGVPHPMGWRVEFVKLDGKEMLSIQMPQAQDGFRAFLSKRGLWDKTNNTISSN